MKRTSLIGHVVELYDAIRDAEHPADSVVKDFFRKRHYLGSKDRRFISDAVYTMLRNYRLLQVYVDEAERACGHSPDRRPASIALYAAMALMLRQESNENLLAEISGLWRVYCRDVNCATFLLALAKSNLASIVQSNPVDRIAVQYSFPDSIVAEWIDRFGVDEAERLCSGLNLPAPITVRVNTLKAAVEECQKALESEGITSTRTKLSPEGLVLEKRINSRAVRAFLGGLFEMQDEGSQLLSMLVGPSPGEFVVDACAGGGGKTLHLAALMRNEGAILTIDTEERRLAEMHERVRRAGVTIVQSRLAGRDATAIKSFDGQADRVLVDSPCTGVGTFRRNPGAKRIFSDASVAKMARLQQTVLDSYAPLVKQGGRLVYATCSLLKSENEHAVERFLARHPEFSLEDAGTVLQKLGLSIEARGNFVLLLPHRTSTDGFFAAILKRES